MRANPSRGGDAKPPACGACATTVAEMRIATLPDDVATRFTQPAFHAAPVVLDAPDDVDRIDSSASARRAPRTEHIPAALDGISTRQLTLPALKAALRRTAAGAGGGSAAPAPSHRRHCCRLPLLASAVSAMSSTARRPAASPQRRPSTMRPGRPKSRSTCSGRTRQRHWPGSS